MSPQPPYEEPAPLPCVDKLAFDSEREAGAMATYVLHRHGTHVRPYKCRYCDLWHLTGQPA